ncbi:hypothetical protein [Flavihumibacter profundi]|jgi:hypothetical protein|uniref:hypothetical protein n=1 Tax=Flavihumibacter profundi TaxID=2716883 RepID=UPI001CC73A2C|nr:hypothetical protein [Flavihumibacter profundi]MBZ5856980.1 hypothetical protein [Flavihumibacter profundi]
MKKIILFVIIAVIVTSCSKTVEGFKSDSLNSTATDVNNSQSSTGVPTAVQTAFSAKYPTATEVVWLPDNCSTWKVQFDLDNRQWKAVFKADGTFVSEKVM